MGFPWRSRTFTEGFWKEYLGTLWCIATLPAGYPTTNNHLGALVLPRMAADFVGQVQACLREAAMNSSDTVDETLSEVTGAVASVCVNAQLWLAEMHGIPPHFIGYKSKCWAESAKDLSLWNMSDHLTQRFEHR